VADAPERVRAERTAELTPACRRVLDALLAGDSEKEAARRLSLSIHTVHDYVKTLYRALGVSSRGELMAWWIKPQ
jgi:DNA-binding CsgD family transcriptional regulator